MPKKGIYLSDYDIFSYETERTSPNVNDVNNFSICRKKMKNMSILYGFCLKNRSKTLSCCISAKCKTINKSKIKSSYEYENILNSDLIFSSLDDFNKKLYYNKKK